MLQRLSVLCACTLPCWNRSRGVSPVCATSHSITSEGVKTGSHLLWLLYTVATRLVCLKRGDFNERGSLGRCIRSGYRNGLLTLFTFTLQPFSSSHEFPKCLAESLYRPGMGPTIVDQTCFRTQSHTAPGVNRQEIHAQSSVFSMPSNNWAPPQLCICENIQIRLGYIYQWFQSVSISDGRATT